MLFARNELLFFTSVFSTYTVELNEDSAKGVTV